MIFNSSRRMDDSGCPDSSFVVMCNIR
nr:TPA_asm: M80 uORF RNA *1 [Murid betaherpesvirus 1]DBA07835.1 TPA_asm: M80 uORF RNA *1 [Murid betaherpesvirus 1]